MIKEIIVGVSAALLTALIFWLLGIIRDVPVYITIPKGSVIAFNLDACPEGGWEQFKPAYGRFVRGIDPTAKIDPDGKRVVGSVQDDEVKSHHHTTAKRVFVHRNDGGPKDEDMNPGGWGGI